MSHLPSHPDEDGRTPAGTSIGVCSWSLQPIGPKLLVEQIRECGLDAVQLALNPLVNDPRDWADTFMFLEDAGIRVLSGMMESIGEDYSTLESIRRTGGVVPGDTWPRNLELMLRVRDLVAESSIGLVSFHAGFIPHDPGDPLRALVVERLRILVDAFADRSITLALETGQETADTLLEVLDEIDRPGLGVNFDPANMILYGMGDPIEAIRLLGPRVVQVHAKDAVPTETPGTWGRETPLGDGAVDWARFMPEVLGLVPAVDVFIEREGGD
ncbi:MAG: sugar phosphate isomerase/epimerase family protein, partial [Planctomycetota bacterium]|nr:sugar phosphate isomerase/epimerase family protein [Planctomycetota bacterium]